MSHSPDPVSPPANSAIHSMPRLWKPWFAALIVLSTVFYIAAGPQLLNGLEGDITSLTLALVILFLIIWLLGLYHVSRCESELKSFRKAWKSRAPNDLPTITGSHATANFFHTLRHALTHKQIPPIDRMVRVLADRLYHPGHLVGLGGNILITFGLIGTVLGLLVSMDGLGEATTNLAGSEHSATPQELEAAAKAASDNMMNSLNHAIVGMGTAFYTTLFGAILGGVIIRVLHGQTMAWIDLYVCLVAEATDMELLQDQLARQSPPVILHDLVDEMTAMTSSVLKLRQQIEELGGPKTVLQELSKTTQSVITSLDETGTKVSHSLDQLGQRVETIEPLARAASKMMDN